MCTRLMGKVPFVGSPEEETLPQKDGVLPVVKVVNSSEPSKKGSRKPAVTLTKWSDPVGGNFSKRTES